MRRSRFVLTLFSTGLALAAGCSDAVSPSSPSSSTPMPPVKPAMVTLTGSIHLSDNKSAPVVLTTDDGQDILLAGANANLLVSVENAGVEVRGEWDADGALFVDDFLVRTVDGGAVIDGVLVAEYDILRDDAEPIGYAIRPTRGGDDIMLAEPSAELLTHISERLWVAGSDNGRVAPTAFGVIQKTR